MVSCELLRSVGPAVFCNTVNVDSRQAGNKHGIVTSEKSRLRFGQEHHNPVPKHSPVTAIRNSVMERGTQLTHVRVLVVDDNAAILDRVSAMLQTEYQVIGKVDDGNCVCAEVKKLRPDLIVLDISMGEHSGIEIAQQLREQGYMGEIVFLTVHEDPDFVSAAIGAGGRGYVIKSRMNVDLGLAVKAVLSHQIFVSSPLHDM
jgi:PleD family two-component response regulator